MDIEELKSIAKIQQTEIDALRTELDEIRSIARVNSNRHHTHSTNACFEDALALTTDIVVNLQQSQEYTGARLVQLIKLLQEGKIGPHNYDPEREAGDRPTVTCLYCGGRKKYE